MISLLDSSRVQRLLCLGAHCDDIEIGAGGTVLKLAAANPQLQVRWVVFGAQDEKRREEARRGANLFLAAVQQKQVELLDFRDAFMRYDGVRLKEQFERLKGQFNPDLILTHHDDDRHQDHRFVNELTWNTWRDHTILEYEIFKYDGDLGRPNVFVPITEEIAGKKVAHLFDAFASQSSKQWFTPDVFLGLMRLRGVECNSPTMFAEAFHARKLTL